MTFRFREFSVEDDHSTMKIGTDAILLGAWTDASKAERILDIGTGCGVIALMMAQRSGARIDAIDIHKESIEQARFNFINSPWKERLTALHRSFAEHKEKAGITYDIILTNPPYFRNSLKSKDAARNLARHHDSLIPEELFEVVKVLLTPDGAFYIILPEPCQDLWRNLSVENGLYLNKTLNIKPKEDKKHNRVLMKFCRNRAEDEVVDELSIRHQDNSFTPPYKELTADFYLSLP